MISEMYELVGRTPDDLAPAVPERPATIIARDPIAYFRYTLEVPNVRLKNFVYIPPPKEKEDDEQ